MTNEGTGAVSVYDSNYAEVTNSPLTGLGAQATVAFDVAGRRAFTGGPGASQITAIAIDTVTPAPESPLSFASDVVFGVAYDPDRNVVYAGDTAANYMGVISAATSNQIGSIFGLDDPREIRYFNGRIYVAESNTEAPPQPVAPWL